jgi:hypothetical protein
VLLEKNAKGSVRRLGVLKIVEIDSGQRSVFNKQDKQRIILSIQIAFL